MSISLLNHPLGYSTSCRETLLAPFFSPYASRHFELAKDNPYGIYHITIGILEYIPVLGVLISLIERVAVAIFNALKTPEKEVEVPPEPEPLLEPSDPEHALTQLPAVLVGKIGQFLDLEHASYLSDCVNGCEELWKMLARRLNIPVAKGQKAEQVIRQVWDDKNLIKFCKLVLDKTMRARFANLPFQKQAQQLRKFLKISPWVESHKMIEIKEKELTSVPPEIQYFEALSYLILQGNLLTSLPQEICKLKNLHILNVSHNQLTCLPKGMRAMRLLKLDVSNNKIKELPRKLFGRKAMGSFSCSHNQLTSIPPGTLNRDIARVDLSHNQLTSLPSDIGGLKTLIIDLSRNYLDSLPKEIGNTQFSKKLSSYAVSYEERNNLEKSHTQINLSHNLLQTVPDELANMQVDTIDLRHNPLQHPLPPAVADHPSLLI